MSRVSDHCFPAEAKPDPAQVWLSDYCPDCRNRLASCDCWDDPTGEPDHTDGEVF